MAMKFDATIKVGDIKPVEGDAVKVGEYVLICSDTFETNIRIPKGHWRIVPFKPKDP